MCLLTYLPEGVHPDTECLLTGARTNSDGHGFAIVIPTFDTGSGRILVRKSMKAHGLIKEFAHLRAIYPDGPALFHSRITTDGSTDLFNCHPFMHGNDKRTVIGHNGILPRSVRPDKGDHRSDTRIFAEEVAGMFKLNTVFGRRVAEEWMGTYNKLVILTVDPAFDQYGYILNEAQGEWYKGSWYSNSSYRGWGAKGSTYYYTPSSGYGWQDWRWCGAPDCPAQLATVSPKTGICSRCQTCDYCGCKPCNCELVWGEVTQGKGESQSSPTVGTVIGGSPRDGATVSGSARDWLEEYDRQRDYQKAIEAGQQAARGIQQAEFDYGDHDDDDEVMTKSQLEQVLALVEVMNNGGDIDDIPTVDESELDRLLTTVSSDVPTVEDAPVGWPDDSGDDQDYLIHNGTKYAVN